MSTETRAVRARAPDEPCLNCGDATPGRFCPSCGQRKTEVLVSVRAMLADVLEDQLVLNRALPRTLGGLLFRPGWLTTEYISGRIVSYIAPFRLYLVSSIVFFLILSAVGLGSLNSIRINGLDDAVITLSPATTDADEANDATGGDAAAPADAAAGDVEPKPDGDAPAVLPPGTLQPWARDFVSSEAESEGLFQAAARRKVAQVGHLQGREATTALLRDLLEYAPHMVFLLLPFYAVLLKLLYVRRKRYYAEHFVFALHVHAFFFVIFTLMFLLPDRIDLVLYVWMIAYVWLAMKRVYRQGWFRTTLKWWVLGWCYSFILAIGLVGLAVATLLLT